MKVALLGATGFVGSAILKEALDRGHKVTAIARDPEKLEKRDGLIPRNSCAGDRRQRRPDQRFQSRLEESKAL